ncbi:MAG: NAD-binding protein [Oscillatoria sp. PMC 1051.18]|nr:NAD-binding protein [Oscillatoria sp. PMC 1050.18]MEC5030721.1 NAD-binding protein [Oscillatoria sp. PMC 1051.18]
MQPRIIVSGLGSTGYKIFCLLRQQGANVMGISDRPMAGIRSEQLVIGDMRSVSTLMAAGIKEAHTLVLAHSDDALNLAILTQARVLNPRIRIINRLYNYTLGSRLDRTLPEHVSMSVSALAAPIFAFAAMGNQAIGQLRLFNQTWPIHEEIIYENHPWLGKPISELWEDISRMLIYYLPKHGEEDLVTAVVSGRVLEAGDRLIVGTKPNIRNRRRNRLWKMLKALTNLRQFQRHARPVALVTLALLFTILVATITYICVNYNTSIVDALYFSVGMITGAGGKEEVAESAPDSIKLFTAIMMIIGAGVIGICYALINDFILGSRLKQFWDAARIPNRNHYVVCGLGGVGMEIVQQLVNQGREVVVIESDPNNRFIHSARSLCVPVIIEDASLLSSLQAANLPKAEALLAVTSNDMVNVEIALCARAIVPKLPVIVRNQDAQFSSAAQEVFEFETVLCPTEIAAPSFAAAALGGRILGNGITEHLLWVALATIITPNHPFCGKNIKEAAMQADFVPLYLETKHETIHGWSLLDTCLQPGEILYLTMPAMKLEQLWRTVNTDSELIISA